MPTGTVENKNQQVKSPAILYLKGSAILHIPGGVTNTSGTSTVPAGLVSVALYVPAVAEVAVMVRVKLIEVVPAGEVEQGLPMV